MSEQLGGLIVRRHGSLHFIPSNVARRVVRRPTVSRVPGTDLGLSLIQGRVMAVIAVAPSQNTPNAELVVCSVNSELVALSGLEVITSGSFEGAAAGGVTHQGRVVPELDVTGEVGRVESELALRRARQHEDAR